MNVIKEKDFDTIYKTSAFDSEVLKLFGKSKPSCHKFLLSLQAALTRLEVEKTPPCTNPFEKIQATSIPLYRIKFKDKENNVRSIFYWHSENKKILLTAFKETAKSDYKEAIDRALSRLKEIDL